MSASRFYFPDRFFRRQDRDTLLAFFTFVDNETGLEFSNWRLLNGRNGPFVAAPSETYEHPEKGTQYYPYVRAAYDASQETNRSPKGDAFMTALTEAAYAMYDKGSPAPAGAASGRGPVAEDEPDDDLPFN